MQNLPKPGRQQELPVLSYRGAKKYPSYDLQGQCKLECKLKIFVGLWLQA